MSAPGSLRARGIRVSNEHTDGPILPGRQKKLAVASSADVQIGSRELRAHCPIDEFLQRHLRPSAICVPDVELDFLHGGDRSTASQDVRSTDPPGSGEVEGRSAAAPPRPREAHRRPTARDPAAAANTANPARHRHADRHGWRQGPAVGLTSAGAGARRLTRIAG